MTTDVDALLKIARQTVEQVRFCFAITQTQTGGVNARIVEPAKPDDQWHAWFMTSRASRKIAELEDNSKLVLAYQYDTEGSCVTLHGQAAVNDDTAFKRKVWSNEFAKWFPGGPEDPGVVIVTFQTERIELWSAHHDVMPGSGSARLDRQGGAWVYSTTEV